ALTCHLRTIYCEFEDPKRYRDAVTRFRRWQSDLSAVAPHGGAQAEILVAPPRIFKPGEDWILQQVRSCGADGWLIRNYDHLQFFTAGRRVGDFSLNRSEEHTAELQSLPNLV